MKNKNLILYFAFFFMILFTVYLQFIHDSILNFNIESNYGPNVICYCSLNRYYETIGLVPIGLHSLISAPILLLLSQIMFVIVYSNRLAKMNIINTIQKKKVNLILTFPLIIVLLRITLFIALLLNIMGGLEFYLTISYYEFSFISLILDIISLIIVILFTLKNKYIFKTQK